MAVLLCLWLVNERRWGFDFPYSPMGVCFIVAGVIPVVRYFTSIYVSE